MEYGIQILFGLHQHLGGAHPIIRQFDPLLRSFLHGKILQNSARTQRKTMVLQSEGKDLINYGQLT